MLSINTDFVQSHGDPEPYLRHIAEAGFTHVHWLHHWAGDFMYSPSEVEQIGQWLKKYNLIFSDLHATEGSEKFWLSKKEYARLAGVELVKNRLDMTAQLGGDAIVLHVQPDGMNDDPQPAFWDRFHRSMDALLPYAAERNVQIAFENLFPRNHETLKQILDQYSPKQVGLCYDSGHGNLIGDGLDFLEIVKDRLIVLHLNDNDAMGDQHYPILMGTVDWSRTAQLIAASSYSKPMCLELSMRGSGIKKPADFLAHSMTTGMQFAELVKNAT